MRPFFLIRGLSLSISNGEIVKIFEKKKNINHPQIDSAYFCDLLLRLNGFTFRKN